MKKYFFLQPRQIGKTTRAMYEYMKDPENSLFVCERGEYYYRLRCDKDNNSLIKRASNSNFEKHLLLNKPKNIIMDEFMSYDNKKEIYLKINELKDVFGIENIYIFSSAYKILNKEIFEFIKRFKSEKTFDELSNKYLEMFSDLEKFNELYYHFITDNDTILIDTIWDDNYVEKMNKSKPNYPESLYKMEVLNQYLTV